MRTVLLRVSLAATASTTPAVIASAALAQAKPSRPASQVAAAGVLAPRPHCAYWTTNGGVAAVVRTRGFNCQHKKFSSTVPPYNGVTFDSFTDYLSQIGEYVNGPADGPNLRYDRLLWSGSDVYTNHEPVSVYLGPSHDDSAVELAMLLYAGTPLAGPADMPHGAPAADLRGSGPEGGRELAAGVDGQLLVGVSQVTFDRVQRDEQRLGDLGVAHPVGG
jgi:hypothetical protein